MKNKLNSLEALGNFVFSTNKDIAFEEEKITATPPPSQQYLEAHFNTKGRGGKTVTLIKGYKGTEENLKELSKMIKTKCAVGGSVQDGEIIIQGNHRQKVMEILKNEGYHVKRVGG
jgi:translation initiation factor 1